MHWKIGVIMNVMMLLIALALLECGKVQSNMAFFLSIQSKPTNKVSIDAEFEEISQFCDVRFQRKFLEKIVVISVLVVRG